MSANGGFQAVPTCYVFKSRLQEYAQKVGLPTPIYETIKEGPSHEPSFRSTVIVNNVRYDSLSGFFNRKAAEQSAAEVALMELANSGDTNECISQAVSETGLCKNLLQEYSQKMNYANPLYQCQKEEMPGRGSLVSCNVEIGGIKYIGAAAHTKKEAEIKAARTALLALQSSGSTDKPSGNSMYTVIPCKRKGTDLGINSQETAKVLKPKKGGFKKKRQKKRDASNRNNHVQGKKMGSIEVNVNSQTGQELDRTEAFGIQTTDSGLLAMENFQDQRCFNGGEEGSLLLYGNGNSKDGQVTVLNFRRTDLGISSAIREGDLTSMVEEANKISGVEQVASVVNNSTDGNSKDGRVTILNFPQSDLGIPNLGSSSTVSEGNLTSLVKEANDISGVEQVASMVNNSSVC